MVQVRGNEGVRLFSQRQRLSEMMQLQLLSSGERRMIVSPGIRRLSNDRCEIQFWWNSTLYFFLLEKVENLNDCVLLYRNVDVKFVQCMCHTHNANYIFEGDRDTEWEANRAVMKRG